MCYIDSFNMFRGTVTILAAPTSVTNTDVVQSSNADHMIWSILYDPLVCSVKINDLNNLYQCDQNANSSTA